MRVFVAGASGAIGSSSSHSSSPSGHEVVGMTRTAAKQERCARWARGRSSPTRSTPTRWPTRWPRPSRR